MLHLLPPLLLPLDSGIVNPFPAAHHTLTARHVGFPPACTDQRLSCRTAHGTTTFATRQAGWLSGARRGHACCPHASAPVSSIGGLEGY